MRIGVSKSATQVWGSGVIGREQLGDGLSTIPTTVCNTSVGPPPPLTCGCKSSIWADSSTSLSLGSSGALQS